MRSNWTRIAATLALVSVALPAGALEYGRWNLIDTKSHREFLADAEAPTSLYGTWSLINVSFDHRWLADSLVRTENAGATEKSRKLVSDVVSYSRKFDATGAKSFGADIVSYDNAKTVEEILGRENQKAAGRPVTFIMEKYRINTIKDKHVTRPWSRIDRYKELERHVRTYSTTLEQTKKLTFKDPITNQDVVDYAYVPGAGSAVEDTGYVENGKILGETVKGTDVLPVTKETFLGATQIREVGRVATAGKAIATASGLAKTFSSNLQVGREAGKVTYSGVEARVAQGIDQTEVAKTKSKGKNKKDDKDAIVAIPVPTPAPTVKPTVAPTVKPTVAPTVKPTVAPTPKPAVDPLAGAASKDVTDNLATAWQIWDNHWDDLGLAIKAADTKADMLAIAKALRAGSDLWNNQGYYRSKSSKELDDAYLNEKIRALPDKLDGASKLQFVMDMFNVVDDILTGIDGDNVKKFVEGKDNYSMRFSFFKAIGIEASDVTWISTKHPKKVSFKLKMSGNIIGPVYTMQW